MKNIWKFVTIGIVLGAILMITGFLAGARSTIYFDTEGIHVGESNVRKSISSIFSGIRGLRFSDWEAEDGIIDIIDEGGWQLSNPTQNVSERNIGTITSVKINVISANIDFVTSNDYGLDIVNYNKPAIRYRVEDGALTITQEEDRHRFSFGFNLFSFNANNSRVTVYLPKGAVMDTVVVSAVSGKIDIEGIDCDDLSADTVSGGIVLSDCTAKDFDIESTSGGVRLNNCSADNVKIGIVSGSLKAYGIKTNGFNAELISGSTTLSGELLGKTNIESTSGSVNITVKTNGNKYQKTLSSFSGSIHVDGEKIRGKVQDTVTSDNKIIVDCLSGSVTLNFE